MLNEKEAIESVVKVLESGESEINSKKLDEIFEYIYNTFMMKENNSGTKGFMNVCIMCTSNFVRQDEWMRLWKKRKQSRTFQWCESHIQRWDLIGPTQIKAAAKLTPSEDPPGYPEWTPLGKYNILKSLVKTVGGQIKKGFPKRCLDNLPGGLSALN